ncbi:DUF6225 family protein (plasmid) [Streptomyces sp. NBC_01362]|uniref:DUF6225 family protein n=1 Tax=Streptomyces sp. NBC_01362 TaxID=2903839 RepID=UPI002E302325|nr:DUF6225 family protein [Streptomyces sp. NBC_01362]
MGRLRAHRRLPVPPGTAGSRPTGPDGPSGPCEAWGTPRTPLTVRTAPTTGCRPQGGAGGGGGVAEDPGDFGGYRESVLVDAHHVENWWPATGTAPERAEKEKALTLFADWTPGEYDLLD